jgi:oligopeptidase B
MAVALPSFMVMEHMDNAKSVYHDLILIHLVTFELQRLTLLQRGFTLAFAHVRGGGELGKDWHDGGKKMNKMNSFHDFIACAEFLIKNGWTNPSKFCAKGVSAGGLLLGTVANMRPDLFQTIIMKVPFLDVYGTMVDPSLPLTEYEYEEWGNIKDPVVREYIKGYSPYQNIKAQRYPNMLISASMNDYRAPYWNSLKYVARLRSIRTGETDIVLRLRQFGHADEVGKDNFQDNVIQEYAFMFSTMGIKEELFV